ncbi:MAG: hypothetical protein AAB493_00280 [Patescibacteria group bacterium]
MKTIKMTLIVIALIVIAASTNLSCEKLFCDGMGTLSLENKSLLTVQKIMINGVNYGSLDPGKTKEIKLTPGIYMWQLVGISGGTGCSAAAVTIVECETVAFSCSAK